MRPTTSPSASTSKSSFIPMAGWAGSRGALEDQRRHRFRPQSSSASRFTAGAVGFFSFSQSRDRPIGRTKPLADNALEAKLAGVPENNIRRKVIAMVVESNACPRLPQYHRGQRALAYL